MVCACVFYNLWFGQFVNLRLKKIQNLHLTILLVLNLISSIFFFFLMSFCFSIQSYKDNLPLEEMEFRVPRAANKFN
jgi:hypothetical protein